MSKYIEFAVIAAALPESLSWTEGDLLKIGRHPHTKLKFVRRGNRQSPPLWARDDVIAWFARTYNKAPALVAEFADALAGRKIGKARSK
jgi:hypothetical protein